MIATPSGHGVMAAIADPRPRHQRGPLIDPSQLTMTVVVRVRAPYAQMLAKLAQAHGRLPEDVARDVLEDGLREVGV